MNSKQKYFLSSTKVKFHWAGRILKDFFIQKLSPELVTIILNDLAEFPLLKDNGLSRH
jgi:hypothetical protein